MSGQNPPIGLNILHNWACAVCLNKNNPDAEFCQICNIGIRSNAVPPPVPITGPLWGAPVWQCQFCEFINENMLCKKCHGCGRVAEVRRSGGRRNTLKKHNK
jgi:hypothetical protein